MSANNAMKKTWAAIVASPSFKVEEEKKIEREIEEEKKIEREIEEEKKTKQDYLDEINKTRREEYAELKIMTDKLNTLREKAGLKPYCYKEVYPQTMLETYSAPEIWYLKKGVEEMMKNVRHFFFEMIISRPNHEELAMITWKIDNAPPFVKNSGIIPLPFIKKLIPENSTAYEVFFEAYTESIKRILERSDVEYRPKIDLIDGDGNIIDEKRAFELAYVVKSYQLPSDFFM